MSRSKRNKGKPPGYDYQKPRAGNRRYCSGVPGRATKTATHRMERRIYKNSGKERDSE